MKAIAGCLIILMIVLISPATHAETRYERSIFDGVLTLLKEIRYQGKLRGKTIAVSGFDSAYKQNSSRKLSIFLASQVDSDINRFKSLMDNSFKTAPRQAIDSIETEFSLSKGHNFSNIFKLFISNDILVTGLWQNLDRILKLELKAIALGWSGIEELTSVSIEIEKETLPADILSELGHNPGNRNSHAGKYRINLLTVNIKKGGTYSRDDSNPAPDAYIMVKDGDGRTIFDTGTYFLRKHNYKVLLRNRNNYHPDFTGASFCINRSAETDLYICLMDYDGFEGFMGKRNSHDDTIAGSCHLTQDDISRLGRHRLTTDGWDLEITIERLL